MNLITCAWLAGLSVLCAFIGIDMLRQQERSYIGRLIAESRQGKLTMSVVAEKLGPSVAVWFPQADLDSLRQKLVWAGLGNRLSAEGFIGLKIILPLLVVLGGSLFISAIDLPPIVVMLLGLVGYIAPDSWLNNQVKKRQQQIFRELPQLLSLLITSVKAGIELNIALQQIGSTLQGPLGEEMQIAWQEISIGRNRKGALRAVGRRSGVREVEWFIETLITAEERGVDNLTEALENYRRELNNSRQRRAEEQAAKISLKMMLPVTVCIFLPIAILLILPGLLSFKTL